MLAAGAPKRGAADVGADTGRGSFTFHSLVITYSTLGASITNRTTFKNVKKFKIGDLYFPYTVSGS